MPSVQELRSKLVDKLKELFQLDQPDLDFGFYRIMHVKAEQVTAFLEKDLPDIVTRAIGKVEDDKIAEAEQALVAARQKAIEFGVPDPDATAPVQEARAALDAIDTAKAEADIYDHLYRFFERYYEDGDFISRRYYTRETPGKAAPYAIPYNGEEVKLHWANADQYYIKTTESFSNFTVDLAKAEEIRSQPTLFDAQATDVPRRVHFQIAEATEGEHGNIKATDQTKRYFIIHGNGPVGFTDAGELVCRFEYRPDPDKTGQEGTWRDKRNAEAVEIILKALAELATTDDRAAEYLALLKAPAPTDKQKDRPLLAKYVNQYTGRNTKDYFIHKDLGGFLRRELDFYIKNEVMRLDDIEDADAPAVEHYLTRIKALREIAGKLIDFLAQLEDFQKKLWLKKKFVVETNYCITLDRIPEEFYPEIAANDAQREEWVRLFAIDEVKGDLHTPGYSQPLTVQFLKGNTGLLVDTKFLSPALAADLLAAVDQVEGNTDGLLVHSENFQALELLEPRYRQGVECIYIDPPYNTSENTFIYKNAYKHSSWLSMIQGRCSLARSFLCYGGVLEVAIDDTETAHLRATLDSLFGEEQRVATIAVEVNPAGQNLRPNTPALSHDYFHVYANDIDKMEMLLRGLTDKEKALYKEKDAKGHYLWDNLRRRGGNSRPQDRPKQWFPLYLDPINKRVSVDAFEGGEETWPIDPKGEQRIWRVNPVGARREIAAGEVSVIEKAGRFEIVKKSRMPEGKKPKTLWKESKYSATTHGTKLIIDILGTQAFSYPKSLHLVVDCIRYWSDESATVFDFFAGSGTTGHAVIRLNQEDDGNRRYVLTEMGDHFTSSLKPRICKVVYAPEWKQGKPVSREGISHMFKYIRLESYEDCLNNLEFKDDEERSRLLAENPDFREDYVLRYMLDVETENSLSLLNVDAFADPTAYKLRVKKPGSDEYDWRNVDLLETFNFLIGLRVEHIAVPQTFTAEFERPKDPELPEEQNTRLCVKGWSGPDERGHIARGTFRQSDDGPWWFRRVEGWVPRDPNKPNGSDREKVLIVWRKLTGDLEKDNLMLDCFFQANRISTRDFEFDTIYVNGSNNLPNLKREGDTWKVRLIEEDFHRLMWDVEDV